MKNLNVLLIVVLISPSVFAWNFSLRSLGFKERVRIEEKRVAAPAVGQSSGIAQKTIMLDSGIGIRGELEVSMQDAAGKVTFVKFKGPTELVYPSGNVVHGHGAKYHNDGFSTPLGPLKFEAMDLTNGNVKSIDLSGLSQFSEGNMKELALHEVNNRIRLTYESGIVIEGSYADVRYGQKLEILTLKDVTISRPNEASFTLDVCDILGGQVISQ